MLRGHVFCPLTVIALLCVCGSTPVFAQGRCAQPVAQIVAAEGEISILPASGTPSLSGPLLVQIFARTQYDICAGEFIRAGLRSRAAVLLLASSQIINLNQNTTIRIVPEEPQGLRSRINLLEGFIRLFNPIGRPLDVRTPYVTAGTEGTEFYVAYDGRSSGTADSCRVDDADTKAGVTEGIVRISRVGFCEEPAAGESFLLSKDDAFRIPRTGPQQRLNVVPTNAVRWTIFYPSVIWNLPPAEEMALDEHVARAWQAWRDGNLDEFAEQLNEVSFQPPSNSSGLSLDARSLLRFAALLLVVGQVEEASEAIVRADALLSRAAAVPAFRRVSAGIGNSGYDASVPLKCADLHSGSPLVLALCAITAVARNQTDEALEASGRAVDAARAGNDQAAIIGAGIARSYAFQSAFRLAEARAALAALASSDDPLVLARLAEIDLSLGDNASARREAQRANEIAPSLSLTSSILGFSALATFDFSDARAAFAKAAVSDPGDPLPHLGLGLTSIRAGQIEIGRREMVIAVALDPESSVARSYLGKTYANVRLYEDAFREWMLAETADPKDPTASLYRAFAERALNRPVAALQDIEKSILLNDNRAVYRSRLLLDQDLATRTTDLASVYRDLGFDQLALSEGYKSVNVDPANPGTHRFLSESYLALPRHETASDSELLQSLLLQPLNVQPLRPRLAREGLGILDLRGPSRIGFNEFSPVFDSNGISVLGDAFGGTQGTYGENLVVSGIRRNMSFSLGQFYFRTDGIRENNQLQRNIENALIQIAVSDRASLFAEFRHSAFNRGDVDFLFDPNGFINPYVRETEDSSQYRLGGRFDVGPGLTFVGVWTRQDFAYDMGEQAFDISLNTEANGDLAEAAVYLSRVKFNVVAGGGYYTGHSTTAYSFPSFSFESDADITHTNAWGYATVSPIENLHLTLGASFDSFQGSTSMAPDRDQFNPKLGLTWEIAQGSVLRAAYFEGLKRTLVGGQTIEPTQIAGFNQLYDDSDSTKAKRWGVGFDQKLSDRLFAGIEWSQRRLGVPVLDTTAFPPATIEQEWEENLARSYLDWVLAV